MNITKAVNKACQEPTLIDALTWICTWESERIVKQARENSTWETLFRYCIREVMEQYPKDYQI